MENVTKTMTNIQYMVGDGLAGYSQNKNTNVA
jgi:hypothetical protein